MTKEEWIEEIKAEARKDGWSDEAVENTTWDNFYEEDMTPREALDLDYSYA